MTTKIITVAAAGSVPAPSSGADYNKGAPLNAVEFDQNIVNLRNAVDAALAALAGYSAGNASGNIPISNGTVNTNLNSDMVDGFHASQTPVANQIPVLNASARLAIGGITFPATQVASSDPNTLDDYEEGTFTPTMKGSVTAGAGTYTKQVGRYTKVGNRVKFNIVIGWSAHTGSGNMTIENLPFVAQSASNSYSCLSVYYDGMTVASGKQVCAYVNTNSSQIWLQAADPAGGAISNIAVDTAVTYLMLAGSYEVA